MSDFKNCQVTKGTSSLRFKRCVSQVDLSVIDSYAALINANGAKLTTIEYLDHSSVTKIALLNPSPTPVVGVSSFYTSVENILAGLSFSNLSGHIYQNEKAEIRYTKLKFNVYTGIGGGFVPIEISFTETSCAEHDISFMDVAPMYEYIVYEVLYNGGYILSDLQNALPFTVHSSIETLNFLEGKHYISHWDQENTPLVNPADPFLSILEGYGGLKSFTVIGQTSGGVKNITEFYTAAEVFYTIPSATIDFAIEVDCSDLSKVKLTDITGVYNAISNLGGYGTPNYPNLADITGTELKIYDGSNVLLGTASNLGYIPSFSPQTFTFVQASELGLVAFRRNKEYRLEYIVHVNDGNTVSCGQMIFIIDQCGISDDPYEQLEDCIINRLKAYFEKECADGCNEDEEKHIDSLIKMKTLFEVLKSSLDQDSPCVTEIDIDKLLEQCKNGCAGC
jgi:hypothetical protein